VKIANPFSLLLIEENEKIAAQFMNLIGALASIRRFVSGEEAEKWLAQTTKPDLIVADKRNSHAAVQMARHNQSKQSVPVLIAATSVNKSMNDNELVDGITDILILTESNERILAMMNYYASLGASVSKPLPNADLLETQQPALPLWKRSMDIAASLTLLVIFSPILLLVAVCILLDSKGPILYKSKRAGANFHVFDMYKFRTMTANADQQIGDLAAHNIYAKSEPEAGEINTTPRLCDSCQLLGVACQQPLFDQNKVICEQLYLLDHDEEATFMKFRNDPRITRLGKFLRNSSIDELPQLINVLIGDMSLVGNRPLPLYEAEKLTTDESAKRFAGPAGLTGLWQIKKRAKGQAKMSEQERIALDIQYADTVSLGTDVYILWQTIFSLWQQENV
jgi:lipopolysaccharide/colanic/teichoic acid biosynthesis glycosyltransferase